MTDTKPNYLYLMLYMQHNSTKSYQKKAAYASLMEDMAEQYQLNGVEQVRYYQNHIKPRLDQKQSKLVVQ